MKALSIRPHWAWAIIHAGKDIENRTWKVNYRGPLAIHASKNSNRRDYAWAVRYIKRAAPRAKVPLYEQLVRGAIIGTVEIVACEKRTKSKWHIRGQLRTSSQKSARVRKAIALFRAVGAVGSAKLDCSSPPLNGLRSPFKTASGGVPKTAKIRNSKRLRYFGRNFSG